MTHEITTEEAIKWLKDIERSFPEAYFGEWRKALRMGIKALEAHPNTDTWSIKDVADTLAKHGLIVEQQPCEDCISREEAINEADNLSLETSYDNEKVEQMLRGLPSVTPQRPKGKWIEVEVRNVYATLKCSVCGRVIEPIFDFCKYSYEDIKRSYPYCHCGAEMSGGGEDEVSN